MDSFSREQTRESSAQEGSNAVDLVDPTLKPLQFAFDETPDLRIYLRDPADQEIHLPAVFLRRIGGDMEEAATHDPDQTVTAFLKGEGLLEIPSTQGLPLPFCQGQHGPEKRDTGFSQILHSIPPPDRPCCCTTEASGRLRSSSFHPALNT